jgi:hypothetical protein
MEEDMMVSPEEMESYMETGMSGSTVPTNVDMDPAAVVAVAGMGLFGLLFGLAIAVLTIVAWWKVFTKAKQPGWAAIVPFYNFYIMLKIVKMSPWYMLVFLGIFVPFIGPIAILVVTIMIYHKLSLAFGKGVGFTIGLILLNPIFILLLAFGDATYKESSVPEKDDFSDQSQKPQDPVSTDPTTSLDKE